MVKRGIKSIIKKEYLIVFVIFVFGFLIRVWSVTFYNTEIGFDQARDLFAATSIFRDHHLAIIGPTAGNNPYLHHGVAWWYFMVSPLIFTKGNPMGVVFVNVFVNASTIIVVYFFAKDFFRNKYAGIIASILTAVSYQIIQYGGWLSNPSPTIFTVPIFFYALWKYYNTSKKNYLFITVLFLGFSIEFELFFIYLIPIFLILFLFLKMKWPTTKNLLLSIIIFLITTSTLVATEFKNHFMGIKSIFFANKYLGGTASHQPFVKLFGNFLVSWNSFSDNFSPNNLKIGEIIGIIILLVLIFDLVKNFKLKKQRDKILFVVIYFLSPALMFLLGTSNEPWFLIGRPIAIIFAFTYVLIKVRPKFIVAGVLIAVIFMNLNAIENVQGQGQTLLDPDLSSIMNYQIQVVDYTYKSANGAHFEINTLTNPLYINAVWGYQYYWYGKNKYQYLPTFAGGDQLYPYNTLSKPNGSEKFLFLIMDTTNRIPPQYKNNLIDWANENSKLIEEKMFGGIDVQKRILTQIILTNKKPAKK
ncbi:MAG TPA: glycosyltransferase family 39 protein [Patescibacteria group bacterium]|nr:glycosyltransferase family 39 protein [Patescibacteria group bacterium]